MSNVKLIVSGAQSGADTGGLEAAFQLGISTTGYMPNGFKREGGKGKEMASKYGLIESDGSYAKRDRQNVDISDGVVGFLLDRPMTGRGTTTTIRYAESRKQDFIPFECDESGTIVNGKKPCLILWDLNKDNLEKYSERIRNFINDYDIKTLMISGPCESTENGIEELVRDCIVGALSNL